MSKQQEGVCGCKDIGFSFGMPKHVAGVRGRLTKFRCHNFNLTKQDDLATDSLSAAIAC